MKKKEKIHWILVLLDKNYESIFNLMYFLICSYLNKMKNSKLLKKFKFNIFKENVKFKKPSAKIVNLLKSLGNLIKVNK